MLALLALVCAPGAAAAQRPVELRATGQLIGAFTSVEPIPGGGSLSEARLTQPILMLHAAALHGHLQALGTLDLEGWTMPAGELAPGAWGEGFNDRRHPHTYAHELILSGVDLLGPLDGAARLSLSAGKGFAPFGTDDPMGRPVYRYPVNHHLAQILERAVAIAGVRAGPVIAEAGLFNGDEPERPGQWPKWDRFGDSWSARLTLLPAAGIELQGSRAKVHSPEHRPGAGSDAWKWSASARLDRPLGHGRAYALAEWARTSELSGFFVFRSVLAEAMYRTGQHGVYYRFEQTDRPEDMRTLDPFRSVRPHLENSILGVTRFTLHTLGYRYRFGAAGNRLAIEPFAEATLGRMRNTDGGVLTPQLLYGRTTVRSISAGLRVAWEMDGHRMGRYGGLLDSAPHGHDMHGM